MEDLRGVLSRISALERDVEGLKRADAKIIGDIAKLRAELSHTATKSDIKSVSDRLARKIDSAASIIVEAVMTAVRGRR